MLYIKFFFFFNCCGGEMPPLAPLYRSATVRVAPIRQPSPHGGEPQTCTHKNYSSTEAAMNVTTSSINYKILEIQKSSCRTNGIM